MKAYYQLLKEKFPRKSDVVTEIINLEAICHLPKGTEYFVSDLHGEYAAFDYILRTASGAIREKVHECFDSSDGLDLEDFCCYLYYPEDMLLLEQEHLSKEILEEKLLHYVQRQLRVIQYIGQKYTRSKVRKAFPANFSYIIEELLVEIDRNTDKKDYFDTILKKIVDLGQLDDLVVALSYTIQRLAMDVLHIVGDIYDRGRYPDLILNRLLSLQNVDIQWGNHDITWMGAVSGSQVCMVNVIRIAARYNNLELIEDRYGINLRKLIDYSFRHYHPLPTFTPILDEGTISQEESDLLNCVQQATAVLQFKLESQLINRRPDFQLNHRNVLEKIDYSSKTIKLDGKEFALKNWNGKVIHESQPGLLTSEEEVLLHQLQQAFQSSEILLRHVDFLFEKGSMYLRYNGNLLFHGCIPLHENGDFKSFKIGNRSYAGKELLDFYEHQIRKSYRQPNRTDDLATDLFWYLWIGENSSLFGKKAMTTFERYYIEKPSSHLEPQNPYYHLRNEEAICQGILRAFDLSEGGHIINGHTPVKEKEGENPVKANGKMLVIDGGFAKGYQTKTGVAGYTLVSNSYGLLLVPHQPFTDRQEVLRGQYKQHSTKRLVEETAEHILVKDTNIGQRLLSDIEHLEHLYKHFDKY